MSRPVKKALVLAHRGAPLNAPENTAASFRKAFQNGADGVECDLRCDRDGEPVLFHDADLYRVTGVRGKVDSLPFSELRKIKVLGKEPIAHLDDLLKVLVDHPGKTCYFDLNTSRADVIEKSFRAIDSAGLAARCFALSFSIQRERTALAKTACPRVGVSVMPLIPTGLLGVADRAGAKSICAGWNQWAGTKSLFMGISALTDFREEVRRALEAGVDVSGGVANTESEIRWFLERGVAGIWTDDVPLARGLIDLEWNVEAGQ